MRVDVKKFLLLGPVVQKKEFFKKAQKLGAIEFIDHSGQKFDILPEAVKKMSKAVRILRGVVLEKQYEELDYDKAKKVTEQILLKQERIESLHEERRLVRQEMSRVAAFGDFNRKDIKFIEQKGKRVVQFFFAKMKSPLTDHPELIYMGSEHDLHYYVAINKERQSYENMVEMVVEHSYGELSQRKKQISDELHQIEYELKELSTYKTLIKKAIIHEFNLHNLTMNHNFVDYHWEESFFSVEVWISKDRVEEVESMIDSFSIYMTEIKMDENEKVPTHLVNTGSCRIGEDLIYLYDTPSIEDKDPSGWVIWAFAFFFAFIVGDGGYGGVFLVLFWVIRSKVKNPTPSVKRFSKLLGILGISCIVWGFCVSSFFGIDISLDSPLKRYAPITLLVENKMSYHMEQKDETYKEAIEQFPHLKKVVMPYEFLTQAVKTTDGEQKFVIYDQFINNIMLELALFVGTIHLICSMLRGLSRSWPRIGWVFFLIGAYLYFPKVLNATSLIHYAFGINKFTAALIGPYILLGGIALALVLSFIQNKLKGAAELMKVVEVFADVLSYLRLYALALAGSIMANTFNSFGFKMPIILGVMVIIIGHSLNIVLSVMGGVIHGLRLNFLEWYHYSFEGEGKKHKPLAMLKFKK